MCLSVLKGASLLKALSPGQLCAQLPAQGKTLLVRMGQVIRLVAAGAQEAVRGIAGILTRTDAHAVSLGAQLVEQEHRRHVDGRKAHPPGQVARARAVVD